MKRPCVNQREYSFQGILLIGGSASVIEYHTVLNKLKRSYALNEKVKWSGGVKMFNTEWSQSASFVLILSIPSLVYMRYNYSLLVKLNCYSFYSSQHMYYVILNRGQFIKKFRLHTCSSVLFKCFNKLTYRTTSDLIHNNHAYILCVRN